MCSCRPANTFATYSPPTTHLCLQQANNLTGYIFAFARLISTKCNQFSKHPSLTSYVFQRQLFCCISSRCDSEAFVATRMPFKQDKWNRGERACTCLQRVFDSRLRALQSHLYLGEPINPSALLINIYL